MAAFRIHQPALFSLRHSPPSLRAARMAAMLPRTRASSNRRLEFEEPKLVEASPTKPFKKRARMTDEPRPSELDVSLLRTEYEMQKGGPSTYVRRRLRQVYEADPKAVEEAIRCGGLAEIKSSRILSILKTLHQERGKLCLEYLRELSTDEIKLELSRFKGVGPKTIACVLMFHLQQNEFPVDTHGEGLSSS